MNELRKSHPVAYAVLAVALGMVLMLLLSWLSDLAEAAGLPAPLVVLSAIVVKLVPVIVAVVLLAGTGKVELIRLRLDGFGRGLACGAVLLALFCVMGFYAVANVVMGEAQVNVPIIIKALIYFLIVGVGEEFLARAVAGETLLEHFGLTHGGVIKACAASGVIFGVMHIVNVFSGVGIQDVAMQIVSTTGLGMLFGAIYFRCGNIWAPVVLHMLWDASLFAATTSADFAEKAAASSSVGGGNPVGGIIFFAFVMGLSFFLLRKGKAAQVQEAWAGLIEPPTTTSGDN